MPGVKKWGVGQEMEICRLDDTNLNYIRVDQDGRLLWTCEKCRQESAAGDTSDIQDSIADIIADRIRLRAEVERLRAACAQVVTAWDEAMDEGSYGEFIFSGFHERGNVKPIRQALAQPT